MSNYNISSEDNQVTIKDLKITGPLAGKKLEIQFDLKPIAEKKDEKPEKKKDEDQDKVETQKTDESSSDWSHLGLLFFLLFALVILVGQTGGFSSLRYAETETPSAYPYRYQPAQQ